MQIKELVNSPPRTGRLLQRYNQGCRQVVGCIPHRIRKTNKLLPIHGVLIEDLEVLLISSQKSPKMMFPKGGWELDEDIESAASRETLEEAGVIGTLGDKLGEWIFKSKNQEKLHEGSMFPLCVTEELDVWPEKDVRNRVWMTVNEAREKCAHSWMKEALDAFVCQVTRQTTRVEDESPICQFTPDQPRLMEDETLEGSVVCQFIYRPITEDKLLEGFVCHQFTPRVINMENETMASCRLELCKKDEYVDQDDQDVDYYLIS